MKQRLVPDIYTIAILSRALILPSQGLIQWQHNNNVLLNENKLIVNHLYIIRTKNNLIHPQSDTGNNSEIGPRVTKHIRCTS